MNKKDSTSSKAMFRRILSFSSAVMFSALPVWAADENVLRPSQLNVNAKYYDGRDVVVEGYSLLGPHQHVLMESRTKEAEIKRRFEQGASRLDDDKYCLTIINPKFLFEKQNASWELTNRTLTLRGKFVADYLNGQMVDLGACATPAGFLIEEIIKSKK